ncbi:hypothetical protein ACFQV6_15950 [Actinoplanes sp. GCM10030250]
MEFVFIEKRPGPDEDRYGWEPFAESDEFSRDWWRHQFDPEDPYILLEVRLGEVEVARLDLEPGVVIDEAYATPELGTTTLEIGFFEVAQSQRRRGFGTVIMLGLHVRYPDRRLLAFSQEADEFWASLGWRRYDHPDGPDAHRPLFMQRAP